MEDDIRDDRQNGQDRQDDIALLELASMIDEDQPIDWDSEEGVVRGDDERAVLAELRVLAALTRVYRDPDAVGFETPQTEVQELVEHGLPPATWGSLEVLEQVGRGGFAKVYRARDPLEPRCRIEALPRHRPRTPARSRPRDPRRIAPRQDQPSQRRRRPRRRAIERFRRPVDGVHPRPHDGRRARVRAGR